MAVVPTRPVACGNWRSMRQGQFRGSCRASVPPLPSTRSTENEITSYEHTHTHWGHERPRGGVAGDQKLAEVMRTAIASGVESTGDAFSTDALDSIAFINRSKRPSSTFLRAHTAGRGGASRCDTHVAPKHALTDTQANARAHTHSVLTEWAAGRRPSPVRPAGSRSAPGGCAWRTGR